MKKKILSDFEICISVPLNAFNVRSKIWRQSLKRNYREGDSNIQNTDISM